MATCETYHLRIVDCCFWCTRAEHDAETMTCTMGVKEADFGTICDKYVRDTHLIQLAAGLNHTALSEDLHVLVAKSRS